MTEEKVDTDKLNTLKIYRIENGWVTEKREGTLYPKINAHGEMEEALFAMIDWLSKAGVGSTGTKTLMGYKSAIQKIMKEKTNG